MSGLSLSLLGPVVASLNNRPLRKFQTKRAQALLIFLATESALGTDVHGRESLMELLWPGLPLKSARVNLRQTLYLLRQTIDDLPSPDGGDPITFLLADRLTVQINTAYSLDLDLADFIRLLDDQEEQWPEAVALYRADFLADFYLTDANNFEEWAGARRAAFRRQALEALYTLTANGLAQGRFDEAEKFGWRQLEIDNLRESAYRQLMQLYAWTGRQAEALKLYETCIKTLDQELGATPDEATRALVEAIRENRLPPGAEMPGPGLAAVEPAVAAVRESPYRGLYSFREVDAPCFFGREAVTEKLVEAVRERPLVAVIGPSGSGKSSVLFAGLVARLRQEAWGLIAAFRPGSDPFQALAAALLPLLERDMSETDRLVETRKLADTLARGELPLADVATRILQKNEVAERMLLAVDQFEELYTLGSEPGVQARFMDSFLQATSAERFWAGSTLTLVLTLRADFLGMALAYRPLADALQGADLKLGPMTRDELAQTIGMPAERRGVAFEHGLMARILDDVGKEPGNLPLLEFALTALWEQQVDGQITHQAYEAIGGVDGALARYADEVFMGLSPEAQEGARRVFLQLVRPGERTGDTRRIARKEELRDDDWLLGRQLADARLVVTGRDPAGRETVELVHETLIQEWARLRAWLEEDRAFRAWQERLRAALRQWEATDRDPGAQLRGAPLLEAEGWLDERGNQLSPDERTFIQASIEFRDQRRAARQEERAARERLRRWIIIGLSAGLLAAIALAAVAGWQWQQATQARDLTRTSLSRQLATIALNLSEEQIDLASLLSVEAYRRADTFEARNSLLASVSASPNLKTFLHGHEKDVRAIAYSPIGRTLATGSVDNTIRLWDPTTGQSLGDPLTAHSNSVLSLAFSPDGRWLASGGQDDTIRLWDTSSLQSGGTSVAVEETLSLPDEPSLTMKADDVRSLAYSPDGRILASGGVSGELLLWDVEEGADTFGQPVGPPIAGHDGSVISVAFSPDGTTLASGGSDGRVLLWDVLDFPEAIVSESDGQVSSRHLDGHSGSITSLAFEPAGEALASASFDGTIILWDVATGQPVGEPLASHTDWVTDVAFSPDGRTLASVGRDRRVLLWDVREALSADSSGAPAPSRALTGHREAVWSLAFSPDGSTLASGGADNKAILWDLADDQPLARTLTGHEGSVFDVDFSPDGRILASGSGDNTVILWDVAEDSPEFGQPIGRPLRGNAGGVFNVSFSPGGNILAFGTGLGDVILWDLAANQPLDEPLAGHAAEVNSVDFSPDGRMLASGSRDQSVVLWDVENGSSSFGKPLAPPLAAATSYRLRIVFSPDGQLLAVASDDHRLPLWDVAALLQAGETTRQPVLPPLSGHKSSVHSAVFSPDGRIVATGSVDRTIILWDVESGQPLGEPLTGHTGWVQRVAFSPDGQTLASVSPDLMVMLWDVASGERYDVPFTGHTRGIEGVAFSPNGRILASSSFDQTIRLWDVDVESWLSRACSRANRNFTLKEWRRFFGEESYRLTCPNLPAPPAE